MLSWPANRGMSCFALKALEEKVHGFKNIDSTTLQKMIKTVSEFVDNTDLWANGQGCREMVNEMLKEHTTLHEIIGGKKHSSKSSFFRLAVGNK